MLDFRFWRALLLVAGVLGAIVACTNSVPRQDSGGAPYDSSQSNTDRGRGGY